MHIYVCNSGFHGGPEGRDPRDTVSVIAVDPATGAMRNVQTVDGVRSPSYVVCNPRAPMVYVAERWINADKSTPTPEQQKGDALATFRIDVPSGTLSLVDRRSTGGLGTMHVNVDRDGHYVFAANPGRPNDPDPLEGHATAIRLGDDGLPGAVTGSVAYDGRPPLWRDRPKSYPHAVFGDPDWRRIFVPHLMTDRVMIYDFDRSAGALATPPGQPYVQVCSAAGPRHIAFRPDGRFFYVANSFDATLAVFSYEAEKGAAEIVQTVSAHPDRGGDKDLSLAHVLVSGDGRFLYCSHRTDNSIMVFALDQESGELTRVQRQEAGGQRTWDFVLDRSGELMLVANQRSNNIVSFRVDRMTGKLSPTGHRIATFSPSSLAMGMH